MRELILAPGEGVSVENPMGGLFTFKITSDESEGALTAIETFVVRQEGPPLHVHDQDELIYTLAGSLRVKLGDIIREVPAGSFVFIRHADPISTEDESGPLRASSRHWNLRAPELPSCRQNPVSVANEATHEPLVVLLSRY
jgi:mannose-6-phosphate isomerase-like protein (cupin superfamily)